MLAKLLKEQEQSTEQINLLRKDVRDFAKEMQRDRLKFIESMKEMPSTPVQPSKTDSESSGESDNDKKEGRTTLKGILLGIAGLAVALLAFRDKIPDAIKNAIVDGLKFGLPDWMVSKKTNEIVNSTPQTLTTSLIAATSPLGSAAESAILKDPESTRSERNKRIMKSLTPEQKEKMLGDRVSFDKETGTFKSGSRVLSDDQIKANLKNVGIDDAKVGKMVSPVKAPTKTVIGSILRKGMAKAVGKSIPVVGAGVGLFTAAHRAVNQDWIGAGLDFTAALAAFTGVGAVGAAALGITGLVRDTYTAVYGVSPEVDAKQDPEGTKVRVQELTDQAIEISKDFVSRDGVSPTPVASRGGGRMGRAKELSEGRSTERSSSTAGVTPVPATDTSTRLNVSSAVDAGTTEAVESNSGGKNVTVVAPNTTNNNTAMTAGRSEGKKTVTLNPVASNASTIDAYAMPA